MMDGYSKYFQENKFALEKSNIESTFWFMQLRSIASFVSSPPVKYALETK